MRDMALVKLVISTIIIVVFHSKVTNCTESIAPQQAVVEQEGDDSWMHFYAWELIENLQAPNEIRKFCEILLQKLYVFHEEGWNRWRLMQDWDAMQAIGQIEEILNKLLQHYSYYEKIYQEDTNKNLLPKILNEPSLKSDTLKCLILDEERKSLNCNNHENLDRSVSISYILQKIISLLQKGVTADNQQTQTCTNCETHETQKKHSTPRRKIHKSGRKEKVITEQGTNKSNGSSISEPKTELDYSEEKPRKLEARTDERITNHHSTLVVDESDYEEEWGVPNSEELQSQESQNNSIGKNLESKKQIHNLDYDESKHTKSFKISSNSGEASISDSTDYNASLENTQDNKKENNPKKRKDKEKLIDNLDYGESREISRSNVSHEKHRTSKGKIETGKYSGDPKSTEKSIDSLDYGESGENSTSDMNHKELRRSKDKIPTRKLSKDTKNTQKSIDSMDYGESDENSSSDMNSEIGESSGIVMNPEKHRRNNGEIDTGKHSKDTKDTQTSIDKLDYGETEENSKSDMNSEIGEGSRSGMNHKKHRRNDGNIDTGKDSIDSLDYTESDENSRSDMIKKNRRTNSESKPNPKIDKISNSQVPSEPNESLSDIVIDNLDYSDGEENLRTDKTHRGSKAESKHEQKIDNISDYLDPSERNKSSSGTLIDNLDYDVTEENSKSDKENRRTNIKSKSKQKIHSVSDSRRSISDSSEQNKSLSETLIDNLDYYETGENARSDVEHQRTNIEYKSKQKIDSVSDSRRSISDSSEQNKSLSETLIDNLDYDETGENSRSDVEHQRRRTNSESKSKQKIDNVSDSRRSYSDSPEQIKSLSGTLIDNLDYDETGDNSNGDMEHRRTNSKSKSKPKNDSVSNSRRSNSDSSEQIKRSSETLIDNLDYDETGDNSKSNSRRSNSDISKSSEFQSSQSRKLIDNLDYDGSEGSRSYHIDSKSQRKKSLETNEEIKDNFSKPDAEVIDNLDYDLEKSQDSESRAEILRESNNQKVTEEESKVWNQSKDGKVDLDYDYELTSGSLVTKSDKIQLSSRRFLSTSDLPDLHAHSPVNSRLRNNNSDPVQNSDDTEQADHAGQPKPVMFLLNLSQKSQNKTESDDFVQSDAGNTGARVFANNETEIYIKPLCAEELNSSGLESFWDILKKNNIFRRLFQNLSHEKNDNSKDASLNNDDVQIFTV